MKLAGPVEPAGPAAKAGVQQGDVIIKVAGQEVTFDNTLSFIVANTPIGATVPIELIRAGKAMTLNATLVKRPAEIASANAAASDEDADSKDKPSPGAEAARQSLGLTLQALTPETRRQLRLPDTAKGVVIAAVNPSSDAATNGLQRGDLIIQINQRPINTPAEAAAAVEDARKAGRDTVLLLASRGPNPARYIGVKLMAKPAAK